MMCKRLFFTIAIVALMSSTVVYASPGRVLVEQPAEFLAQGMQRADLGPVMTEALQEALYDKDIGVADLPAQRTLESFTLVRLLDTEQAFHRRRGALLSQHATFDVDILTVTRAWQSVLDPMEVRIALMSRHKLKVIDLALSLSVRWQMEGVFKKAPIISGSTRGSTLQSLERMKAYVRWPALRATSVI